MLVCINTLKPGVRLSSRRRRVGPVWLLSGLLLNSLLLTMPLLSLAASISISHAATRLQQGVYLLNASIRYDLSADVLDALNNGVQLTLSLDMQVRRARGFLWDQTVHELQQSYTLRYHALSRQYVVNNVNSNAQNSFPTRTAALAFLGQIEDFPLLDKPLLQDAGGYSAWLRARLDIDALPAPLRPLAYLSSQWRLSSEWYSWPL